ncbi:F-box/WD repeat-containing protein 7 [Phytophthora citrophthora]|uniref:F-box/WD repeat-containing protein 7 n=1 Tax=Phytophthora citrophthora TaxID=4793 RepID=A0AAD9LPS5_9STRA|nr:F-box/WD repeat-containing protein 7 [Phytophthora citrophthora]
MLGSHTPPSLLAQFGCHFRRAMSGVTLISAPCSSPSLSPTRAALASASEKAAAKPGQVVVGPLRVRVLQAIDLPTPKVVENGTLATSSWLHFPGWRPSPHAHGKAQHEAVPDMICVLLRATHSGIFATESRPWASAICWDEEFFMDKVSSSDDLELFCVDRASSEPHKNLPLQGDISACPGFIGKVTLPLSRLPEGQEVEQWYPLVPKGSSSALRTALRVSLCFVPNGVPVPVSQSPERRRVAALPASPATEISSASPVSKHLRVDIPESADATIPLASGVIDYVIVVGSTANSGIPTNLDEAHVRFRYPATDRPDFPLPTKVEWFCFSGGPEIITQVERPQSRQFSFVLVGGDDGLCRCYVVCLVVYHRRPGSEENEWHATCVAFLTRIPLIQEVTACLLAVAHTWMAANARWNRNGERITDEKALLAATQKQLSSLCHEITLPVRGVFGVQFAVHDLKVRLMMPSMTSIYMMKEPIRPELRRAISAQGGQASPKARSFIAIQQGFQPLVYSLEPIFQLFDIKTIIYLVTLVLCEYRILIHSTQQSLLCPVAEGLCALIYPFRWQHPYVPILPRVLSEYLQAPLPYILGVHTDWLQSLIENGRPEHLVVVDIDQGTIQLQEAGGPVLPNKLATALQHRLRTILYPPLFGEMEVRRRESRASTEEEDDNTDVTKEDIDTDDRAAIEWKADTEKHVRMEFVCFLSSLVRGYRECLFFVNQKLPVFNKRRFFENELTDTEVVPLVTRLFCTQAFQAFLESHSSAELSVFHSVYLTLCRGPNDMQWSQSIRALTSSKSQRSFLDTGPARTDIPVLVIENTNTEHCADSKREDEENVQLSSRAYSPSFNGEFGLADKEMAKNLSENIEKLLAEEETRLWDPFALGPDDYFANTSSHSALNHEILARKIGVEPNLLKANAHLLKNAHQVNQYRIHLDNTVAAALAGSAGPGGRFLSSEDERIEQMLHKCLTAVFTSDDSVTQEEIRACEAYFKSGHARDLFVLILMQPSNQYVESISGSPKASGTKSSSAWYNPKGSGSCIGAAGFRLLARLTSALMKQCAIHEDYSTARGVLQVAHQYYHYVEDKHSGIGFAKKEYLVTPLRLLPICRSLDLWQHAFICEIDAVNQANPTESDEDGPETVGDELFFSVIGSLMYDMLNFEVPLQKVLTFVTVMCSTYHKGQDLLDTLKQLAENVYRALDMSKDIKPSPPKGAVQSRIAKAASSQVPAPSQIEPRPKMNGTGPSSSTGGVFAESPVLSREYDLNTVIRRKMSVREVSAGYLPSQAKPGNFEIHGNQAADWMSRTPPTRRRRSSGVFPSAVVASSGSPVLCLATDGDRAACGVADAHVNVVDIDPSEEEKGITLEGHSDAVVTLQMRGNALVSGSRDHTLRAWDVRATPKKRNMFAFFSLSYTSSNTMASTEDCEVDGASISKRSVVMRGHLDAITCMELGHQLGSGRSLLVSGSDDGTVRLWDTTKEASVGLLSGHKGTGKPADNGGVSCLRLLSSDEDLALGYRRRTLQIWDLAVSKLKVNVEAHQAGIRDLQVSGTRLVTAANDRVVKVWDTAFREADGSMQPTQELHGHGGPVQCVSLGGPADPTICTGAADGFVRVWDLRYVQRGPRLTLRGHVGPVTRLQRDFTKLVSAGEDGWLRVWDMHSGSCLRERQSHSSGVTCLEMKDSLVYSGSWDGSVRVWDIERIGNSGNTI